jgi:hypothetical protein
MAALTTMHTATPTTHGEGRDRVTSLDEDGSVALGVVTSDGGTAGATGSDTDGRNMSAVALPA